MEYVPAGEVIGSSRHPSVVASSAVSVPTPSRDLSSRSGAYTKNILRLEQSAEELSAEGSDIGDQIRRLEVAERSRQNSIQGSQRGDIHSSFSSTSAAPLDEPHRRSRTSSYANSIIDYNSAARARGGGGYSPAVGHVTSPVGSVQSSSWSKISMHRRISTGSRNSKLAGMVESNFEDRPLDLSFGAYDFVSAPSPEDAPSRQLSQASYERGDDGAAPNTRHSVAHDGREQAALQEHEESMTPPQRPGSTDTFQQAQTAFDDFDGVHCTTDMEEFVQLDQDGNEVRKMSGRPSSGRRSSGRISSGTASARVPSMLLAPGTVPLGVPPPEAGMVYYPAPVPRMLNLPKRLSQLPAANTQSSRRSQVMSQMYAPNRNSAIWLSQNVVPEERNNTTANIVNNNNVPENTRGQLNERLSVANFSNVPPQLRASVFFEHQTVVHDVNVKSESAVATLDSILAASATAPVSAFTDHPYAGDISKTIFAAEKQNRRSTATTDQRMSTAVPLGNRRSNLSALLRRRSSNMDVLDDATAYTPLGQQGGRSLQARKSQISLADAETIAAKRSSRMPLSGEIVEEPEEGDNEQTDEVLDGNAQIEQDFKDAEDLEDIENDEDLFDPTFTQPTTLLAELQVRKAQLKSRNRTAATSFPNGMHSTLLQLDAVAEIDKKKRSNQRVALAWEDPALQTNDAALADEDDDVPLGVLFPSKNGLLHRKMGDTGDWDRPLGLMEKREMEDSEPLSSRRSRLRGEPIQRARAAPALQSSSPYANQQAEVEGQEGQVIDDETLAERLRRVSTKDALDAAIADVVPKDGSRPLSTFTDDVITQLNMGDAKKEDNEALPPQDAEDETLGQRRARLQREKEAGAAAEQPRPALQTRNSMSNLLAMNPIGHRAASREQISNRGTLLHASEQAQAEHKRNMLASNMRSTSYGLQRPLANNSQSTVNLAGPIYNNGLQTSASTPMLGMQNGYFPAFAMNTVYGQPGMANPYAHAMAAGQPGMINPYAQAMAAGQPQLYNPYPGMSAHAMAAGQPQIYNPYHGMPAHGMAYPNAMNYGYVQPNIQQRSAIDQWRLNIAR